MIVTNKQRTDGFGAIFQNILYILVWANDTNHKFLPSYNETFEHNYTNEKYFVQNLNKFMGFDYTLITTITEPVKQLYTEIYPYVEQRIDKLFSSDVFLTYKKFFFHDKKNPYDGINHIVAVHIRRHNSHDSRIAGTDTPNEYYLSIINKIRSKYTGEKELKFCIYSQGSEKDFELFKFDNVELILNTTTESTFLGLVYADELITSASSLSYVAGLLTNGKVHYKTFWHPPLQSWIKY